MLAFRYLQTGSGAHRLALPIGEVGYSKDDSNSPTTLEQ
jgi:hypothetical protein